MNDRQRAFAEYYSASGNATEAAKKAGYSSKTAYSQGQRLLKKDEIAKYIKSLQDDLASARIATAQEVKETLSHILREGKDADRIKAGNLLLKSGGEYVQAASVPDDETAYIGSGGGAVVMLPWVCGGNEAINGLQTETGEIVPCLGHEADDVIIYLSFADQQAIEESRERERIQIFTDRQRYQEEQGRK